MTEKELKDSLEKKVKNELVMIAKHLEVPSYSTKNKQELIGEILRVNHKELREHLFPSWWEKHHNHFYGLVGLFALIVTIYFYFNPNESSDSKEKRATEKNIENSSVANEERDSQITSPEYVTINKGDLLTVESNSGLSIVSIEVIPVSETEYNCEAKYKWRSKGTSSGGAEASGHGTIFERKTNLPKPGYVKGFNEKIELEIDGQIIEFSCKDENGVYVREPKEATIGFIRNKPINTFQFN